MAWLTGQKSMPFGPNGEHTTVRLINFDHLEDDSSNQWVISTEVTFKQGRVEKRFDLVLWCNGFPLVVGEAKTPVRAAYTWIDGAAQVHDDYEQSVPQFFVPNVFSFATEGKDFRYGTVGMPVELWGPWREETTDDDAPAKIGLVAVKEAVEGVLKPAAVLEFLRFFTIYATDKKHRKIKIIARFQQFQATNLIVERVLLGKIKQGLIWHFQGSGKSLLMVFTALKLRAMAALTNPTILIVVDRIDLDTQITGTFNASDVPGLVSTDSRAQLQTLLSQGARKVIITTIHKFGEAPGVLDDRHNIIAMVDEAHRSQEGDYGQKMREALPNAFLFGLTGTPINKRDRNTFMWFGSPEDEGGYLSRYSFHDSIRDGATLPLHFEPRLSELHIDQEAIDTAFEELAVEERLTEADKITLSKKAASIEVLIKTPSRIAKIAADIADHFTLQGRAAGVQGAGRRLRQGLVRRVQGGARQAPRPGRVDDRDVEVPRRLAGLGEVDAGSGGAGAGRRAIQRPGRSAEDHHRHGEAADRVSTPRSCTASTSTSRSRSTRSCRRSPAPTGSTRPTRPTA